MLIQLLILLLIAGVCGALPGDYRLFARRLLVSIALGLSARFWDRGSREHFNCGAVRA